MFMGYSVPWSAACCCSDMDDELRWRLWAIARFGSLILQVVSIYLRPVKDESPRGNRVRMVGMALSIVGLESLLRQIWRHRKKRSR